MNDVESILKELMNGDFEKNALIEISQMIEEEMAKPAKGRDYNKIAELTKAYTELSGMEGIVQEATERGIGKLDEQVKKPRIRMTRRVRKYIAVACAALVLLTANAFTVSAFDMNIFSFIVHIVDGGFSIAPPPSSSEVSDSDIIKLSATPDDPYGMIAECAKYGIYPETPYYLPEDYVLTLCRYADIPSYVQYVKFTFTNRHDIGQTITFNFELYENEESMSGTKFHNVEHNLSEFEINDRPAILAEEQKDKQFTVVYCIDTLMVAIFTQDVPKEEVNQIISSMK